jgi:hypothetical protein
MLIKFNECLLANLPDLREKKGDIGCPAGILQPAAAVTRVECLHVCGVLFPRWKSRNSFYNHGRKHGTGNCPCTKYGITATRTEFWRYVDKIVMGV